MEYEVDDPVSNEYEQRRFSCDICGKRFKKGNQLRQHMIIHKPSIEKPFSCVICGKSFNRKNHLKSHMVTHTKDSPYMCPRCGIVCPTSSNLKRHEEMHLRNEILWCKRCKKEFIDESSLEEHLLKHTNEDWFPCPMCGKKFRYNKNMRNHLQGHAEQTETEEMVISEDTGSVQSPDADETSSGNITTVVSFKDPSDDSSPPGFSGASPSHDITSTAPLVSAQLAEITMPDGHLLCDYIQITDLDDPDFGQGIFLLEGDAIEEDIFVNIH